MIRGLLGRKLGMTQLFDETGAAMATTIVEAGPCLVTQIKTLEQRRLRGRPARVRGDASKLNSAGAGHLKAGVPQLALPARGAGRRRSTRSRVGRTIRRRACYGRASASTSSAPPRARASRASSSGTASAAARRPTVSPTAGGRLARSAAGTTPGAVMKGMRMAGHMGDERVTVQNLEVVAGRSRAQPDRPAGRGAGPRGGLLMIKKRGVEL